MNIVQELKHLSTLEITSFLSRQLRLYGNDAKIQHVIKPLKEHAALILSTARTGDPSSSQKSAAFLLSYCDVAIESNSVDARLQELIVGAWVGLELDAVETGEKHRAEQSHKATLPRGKGADGRTLGDLIKQLAKQRPNEKPSELWPHFGSALSDWADNCTERTIGSKTFYRYSVKDHEKTISFKQFSERLRLFKNTV